MGFSYSIGAMSYGNGLFLRNHGIRAPTPALPETICQSEGIGLNHEIAILAEVVMKTRQYLQTNCNGVLQCNDVSK